MAPFLSTAMRLPSRFSARTSSAMVAGGGSKSRGVPLIETVIVALGRRASAAHGWTALPQDRCGEVHQPRAVARRRAPLARRCELRAGEQRGALGAQVIADHLDSDTGVGRVV